MRLGGILFLATSLTLFVSLLSPAPPAEAGAGIDSDPVEEIFILRNALIDSVLSEESLNIDTTGVFILTIRSNEDPSILDSLDRANNGVPRSIRANLRPFAMTSYNRVEGTRTGVGIALNGPGWFTADGAVAYGFGNHRWSGIGGAGYRAGRGGPRFRIEGQDRIDPFGPNSAIAGLGLQAFVAGQDRRDYLRRRGGKLTVRPFESRSIRLRTSLFHYEDLPVFSTTDFSLFDGEAMKGLNPLTDRGRSRGAAVGGSYSLVGDVARLEAEAGVAGGSLGGDFDYSWQAGTVTLRPVFPDGGILNLSVSVMNTGGSPPVQSRAFLGGEANLRGYDRLEFVGKQVMSARVEYESGVDLLGRSGIPWLRKLRLQFIPFADFGSTWGAAAGVDRTSGVLEGEVRNSVGIGIQRDLWLPGAKAVRLDVIRRTDGSPDDWSFWFRIIPMPNN